METKQGILFLFASVCLSVNMAAANDEHNNQSLNKDVTNFSDLSQLSGETSPSLPEINKFAGELRTSVNPDPGSAVTKADKVAVNKSELSKAMLGKFRINGI